MRDKVALIAGGAGDIEATCARAHTHYGARITIFDRGPGKIRERLGKWKKEGIQADSYYGDITDEEFLEPMIGETATIYRRTDTALNNTAMTNRRPVLEFTTTQWRDVIDINLNGAYYFLREVERVMCGQDHGKTIQILSTGTYRFGTNFSAYGASKAGASALVRYLVVGWAPHNTQVDGIAPTATETDFTRDYYKEYPERMEAAIQDRPYKRLGQPEGYVGAAVYLASEATDFVDGEVIIIDSGKAVK